MKLRTRPRFDADQRDDQPARTSRRKGVLVCPDCGHESHADGDWIRRESADRTSYECPVCGAVVVSQPTFDRATAD
ncbi:MAG TPA: hypothetical protein VKA37_02360 [Halobacteriales archaeon]|nr:hypothetical protein [Halobacteriales archaeon]